MQRPYSFQMLSTWTRTYSFQTVPQLARSSHSAAKRHSTSASQHHPVANHSCEKIVVLIKWAKLQGQNSCDCPAMIGFN